MSFGQSRRSLIFYLTSAICFFGLYSSAFSAEGTQPVNTEVNPYTLTTPVGNQGVTPNPQPLTPIEAARLQSLWSSLTKTAGVAASAPVKRETRPPLLAAPSEPSQERALESNGPIEPPRQETRTEQVIVGPPRPEVTKLIPAPEETGREKIQEQTPRGLEPVRTFSWFVQRIEDGWQVERRQMREQSFSQLIEDLDEVKKVQHELVKDVEGKKTEWEKTSVPSLPAVLGQEVATAHLLLIPDADLHPYLRFLLYRPNTSLIKAYLKFRQSLRLRAVAWRTKEKRALARYAYQRKAAPKRLTFADGTVMEDQRIVPAKHAQTRSSVPHATVKE